MQAQIPPTVRSSKYRKCGVSRAEQLSWKRVISWHLFTGLKKKNWLCISLQYTTDINKT